MVELPLPSTDREADALVEWMTDTLCLVRKRGDAMADNGRAGPVHRLLRDHLFGQPNTAWDAQMLADELALMPASLNHHLTRLREWNCRLHQRREGMATLFPSGWFIEQCCCVLSAKLLSYPHAENGSIGAILETNR